jgi:hypothetical protein
MQNGRLQTLFDVMDFYDRGGGVQPDRERNPDIAPVTWPAFSSPTRTSGPSSSS